MIGYEWLFNSVFGLRDLLVMGRSDQYLKKKKNQDLSAQIARRPTGQMHGMPDCQSVPASHASLSDGPTSN